MWKKWNKYEQKKCEKNEINMKKNVKKWNKYEKKN